MNLPGHNCHRDLENTTSGCCICKQVHYKAATPFRVFASRKKKKKSITGSQEREKELLRKSISCFVGSACQQSVSLTGWCVFRTEDRYFTEEHCLQRRITICNVFQHQSLNICICDRKEAAKTTHAIYALKKNH